MNETTRSERTKARLLTAAERLFARQGIEGTSLREIVTAAGLSNMSSVQYHFGGKDELLNSLFLHRMLQMEGPRGRMLERARKSGSLNDMRRLMSIICLPHLDLVDSEGRYSYAEFLTQYLLRYRPPVGPLTDPPEPPAPVHLFEVQRLIREQLQFLPEEVVVRRMVVGVLSFLTVLINHRSFSRGKTAKGVMEEALADTLAQISGAMLMPFSPDSKLFPV